MRLFSCIKSNFLLLPITIEEFIVKYDIRDFKELHYKKYLSINEDTHHYGALETKNKWLEDAIIIYNSNKE